MFELSVLASLLQVMVLHVVMAATPWLGLVFIAIC